MDRTMKTVSRLHLLEILLLVGTVLLLSSGAAAFRAQSDLADQVVRLHVLANSDSEEDQALKLLVRDVVLERAESILEGVLERDEAESLLRGQLLELERLALKVVRESGYVYPVKVELAETEFPTREYEGFALPAGRYLALRVLIGDAEGQNWWCVVFPPLCAAAVTEPAFSALSDDAVALITEGSAEYVLKFKAVELWQTLRQRLT